MDYTDRLKAALLITQRDGIENVIQWMDEHHFFEVPASVNYHNNFAGGLAKHSWEVYEEALLLDFGNKTPIPGDSIAIAALLHDICKTDNYYISPHTGMPRCNMENKNKGHGLRSVSILENLGLELTEDERMAIWWHMGKHEPSLKDYASEYARSNDIALCNLIRKADSAAARNSINQR